MEPEEIKRISIEPDNAREAFKLASDNRKLEIDLLWRRTIVFWGFIAALFIGVATTKEASAQLAFVLSCLGLVFSFIWTLANRASKAWQESWEIKSEYYFSILDPCNKNIYFRVVDREKNKRIFILLRPWPYSLSRLLILLSDFSVIFWLGMCMYLFPGHVLSKFPLINVYESSAVIFFVICVIYCFYIAIAGKSKSQEILKEKYTQQKN